MKKTFPCLLTALLSAVSYGVDLKCDIDLCGTSYLKTIMDHPDGRCRATDAFEACVQEACKNSPYHGKVNYVYIAKELFGITSCTKNSSPSAVSNSPSAVSKGVDLMCDFDLCGTRYFRFIMDNPDGRCRAADDFKRCAHEACKDSPINGLVNYVYIAMETFGISSCAKDAYYY